MLGFSYTVRAVWFGLSLQLLALPTNADYDCVCNYKVESPVYKSPDKTSDITGYMYEFDCKPTAGAESEGFHAVQYEHMVGYIASDPDISAQICSGDLPEADKLTTAAPGATTSQAIKTTTHKQTTRTTRMSTTTPMPSTTTIATTTRRSTTGTRPTTITTTRPTTTTTKQTTTTTRQTTTTTKPTTPTTMSPATRSSTRDFTTTTQQTTTLTSNPQTIPEGHIELCPNISKADVNRNNGFLGQYGDYCYEYVPYQTQWKNAERHCNLVSSGHLAHIASQAEQDYIVRFLKSHQHNDRVWIGLTDSDAEGVWEWSSGVNVTFSSFTTGYANHTTRDHKLNDCIVLDPSGGWVDLPCGVTFVLGTGFGESHAYVCQFNLTSRPPGIFDGFLPGFVIG